MKHLLLCLFVILSQNNIYTQLSYLYELKKLNKNLEELGIGQNKKKYHDGSEFFETIGKTKNEKYAKFEILIITQSHKWILKDTLNIENGNLNDILPKYLEYLPNLKESNSIICIGTASHEGDENREYERSKARSKIIAETIVNNNLYEEHQRVYYLPIGKHNPNKKLESRKQRPLILVGGIHLSNLNEDEFKEALYDGLLKEKEFKVQFEEYSRFDSLQLNEYKISASNIKGS